MAQRPLKKYQKSGQYDPTIGIWTTSFVMLALSAGMIALNDPSLNLQKPYSRIFKTVIVILAYITLLISGYASRRNIHVGEDPAEPNEMIQTIVNVMASCIPFLLIVFGSSGISSALVSGDSQILKSVILFAVLAIPVAICSALYTLFARNSKDILPIVATLSGIFLPLTGYVLFVSDI